MKAMLAVLLWLPAASLSVPQFVPTRGFVPDAATAIAVARAVLIPVYGVAIIQDEEQSSRSPRATGGSAA